MLCLGSLALNTGAFQSHRLKCFSLRLWYPSRHWSWPWYGKFPSHITVRLRNRLFHETAFPSWTAVLCLSICLPEEKLCCQVGHYKSLDCSSKLTTASAMRYKSTARKLSTLRPRKCQRCWDRGAGIAVGGSMMALSSSISSRIHVRSDMSSASGY